MAAVYAVKFSQCHRTFGKADVYKRQEVECAILTIFPVENREYIALLPLDENGQNETGEVYLYSFSRTAKGDPMLANIEDDAEYAAAADAFNAVIDKARADEEANAPLS